MIERHETGPLMAQCVVHAGTIYLAGLVADDCTGGVADQARQVLAKIDRYLEQAGSDRSRLLQCHIWLTDLTQYAAFNEVWRDWIPADAVPARACVKAELARPEWQVEVMAIAAQGRP